MRWLADASGKLEAIQETVELLVPATSTLA